MIASGEHSLVVRVARWFCACPRNRIGLVACSFLISLVLSITESIEFVVLLGFYAGGIFAAGAQPTGSNVVPDATDPLPAEGLALIVSFIVGTMCASVFGRDVPVPVLSQLGVLGVLGLWAAAALLVAAPFVLLGVAGHGLRRLVKRLSRQRPGA